MTNKAMDALKPRNPIPPDGTVLNPAFLFILCVLITRYLVLYSLGRFDIFINSGRLKIRTGGPMEGRFLFDMHLHCTNSPDSRLLPKSAMTRARELGLRGLSFTDHDHLTVIRSPFDDLLLVPGAELSTDWGDLLAIGISELPPAGRPVPDIIDNIHRQGGVAVVPHPFCEDLRAICMNERVLDVIDLVDGLEVTSPKGSVDNPKARRLAIKHGKAIVGGSDAHSVEAMGWGFTACDSGTVDGLLKAIRAARTDAFIRRAP
jgi:predicted metal-dependent phosphoesterase TrpH